MISYICLAMNTLDWAFGMWERRKYTYSFFSDNYALLTLWFYSIFGLLMVGVELKNRHLFIPFMLFNVSGLIKLSS